MPAQAETQVGMAIASPEQPFKWITLEEAKKFEKLLNRRYIKRGDKGDARKFFYVPHSINPYTTADFARFAVNPAQQRFEYNVQKYHRNQLEKVTVAREAGVNVTSSSEERPAKVEGHVYDEQFGQWVCVDPTASFRMDVEKFKAEFEPDNIE